MRRILTTHITRTSDAPRVAAVTSLPASLATRPAASLATRPATRLAAVLALGLAAGCPVTVTPPPATAPPPPADPGDQPGEPAPPEIAQVSLADVGLDAAAMNTAVNPCDDFYQYACGGWLASHDIPADRSRYSRFSEIIDRNEATLRAILEQAQAAGPGADPVTARLGAFYGACMDEAAIEAAGLNGAQPLLDAVRAARRPDAILGAVATLHRHGVWALFSVEPESDFKDSTRYTLFLDTAGLGLPDRDYYLKDDDNFAKARDAYRAHVEAMFQLLGRSPAQARVAARDVLKVERTLAELTKTRVERRDVAAMYNPHDRAQLAALSPRVDWDGYFRAIGRPDIGQPAKAAAGAKHMSVTTPAYFAQLGRLLRTIPVRSWQYYLEWQILHSLAPHLGPAFVNEDFKLDQALTGQPELSPRWKRCVGATDDAIGEDLGQKFVASQFPGESKQAAQAMVAGIAHAFTAQLDAIPWMSEQTKAQARTKAAAMANLIGFPDKWRDYPLDPAAITRDGYTAAVVAARAYEVQRDLAKPGTAYDRGEWFMTPQTVNAYYNPLANQMVFPAGILQPPFFGIDRSVAANLGGMGMVVGHELTHGFDDNGAQFDDRGNMRNWWQPDDASQFKAKGECLAAQYSTFEPLPGLHLNGKLTLGENIADLGGVKLAFRAYRAARADARPRYVADGLTEDQQFFVAVAQAWCSKTRDAEVQRRVVTDPHSPPEFRVKGSLINLPAFAEAFSCQPGSAMRPADICQVW